MKQLNIKTSAKQIVIALVLFIVTSTLLQYKSIAQQQIGYYPNMDGGFQNQAGGNLTSTQDTLKWTFVASGNGQQRSVVTSGGYGGAKYVTVGKTAAATTNSSTTINSNQVKTATLLANTLYVIQFYYKADPASVGIPDSASYVFVSVDGTSGNRRTKLIKLATPSTWTKYIDTVRTNNTANPTSTGTAGINIKTSTIGVATIVDVDNFVIYPADDQVNGGSDLIAPTSVLNPVAIAPTPADILLSWSVPTSGIDTGGYVVVRYTTNPDASDNPLQNAIYSVGDSVNNNNSGIVVYIGKNMNFDDVYKVTGNTTYYYKIYAVDKAFNYSPSVSTQATTTNFTYYYYNGSGALDNVSSWGSNTNGSGTAPSNFTAPGQFFFIQNGTNLTLSNPWTVSGSSSKVILGDINQPAINFTVSSTGSLVAPMDIVTPASGRVVLNIYGGIMPTWGVVTGKPDLNIATNVNTTIQKAAFNNVVINTPTNVVVNMSDTLFVNNFTVNTGAVFSSTTNNNVSTRPIIIDMGGSVIINGTFKTGKTYGFVDTIGSDLSFLGTPNYTLGANSTIVYDKVATSTIQRVSAIQYANLVISGSSIKRFEPGTLKVTGDFVNNNLFTSATKSALFIAPTSIEFNGTGVQNIDSLPAPYFSDVTFSGGGLKKLHTSITINGITSFVNGKVDLGNDTLTFTPIATVGQGVINSYIVTGTASNGRVHLLGVGANSFVTVPIGSNANYLPVTLTPSQSSEFAVAAFDGLTTDGTFGGTPVSAAVKSESVNAFWNISNFNGTGKVLVEVNWPKSLEGATFSSLLNNQIKLIEFNGSSWVPGSFGTADNSNNIANDSFATFTVFTVSKFEGLLPVSNVKLKLTKLHNTVLVNWNTVNEFNTSKCIVERSFNGVDFSQITVVDAMGNASNEYSFIDKSYQAGINYYRIKILDKDGTFSYSAIASINAKENVSIQVLNNPIRNNTLSIKINAIQEGMCKLSLTNSLGQRVITTDVTLTGNSTQINLPFNGKLTTGTYYLSIKSNNINNTIPVLIP